MVGNMKEKDVDTFYDGEGNYLGFAGFVDVYKKKIFIDTRNGTGYDDLLETLDGYINKVSSNYRVDGQSYEDIKQDIVLKILEGVPKYNPNKGTKLSTFIYMRTKRMLINDMILKGSESRNSTILKTSLFTLRCDCGNSFTLCAEGGEISDSEKCLGCGKKATDINKKYRINKGPASIYDARVSSPNVDIMSDLNDDFAFIKGVSRPFFEQVECKKDLDSFFKSQGDRFGEVLRLICFQDHSLYSASVKAGVSHSFINNRVNKIRKVGIKNFIKMFE